jgi:predicted DNA-binding transcriptional regulator YafY
MQEPRLREGHAVACTLKVLSDLMGGARLDRTNVAERCGIQLTAAARRMRALEKHVPGVRIRQDGRRRVIYFQPVGAPVVRRSVAESACIVASLAHLFRGTAHEHNMRQVRETLLRQLGGGAVLRDLDRKFIFVARGSDPGLSTEDLDDIVHAVIDGRRIRFHYENFDGEHSKPIATPYSLAIYDHQLYVVAVRPDGALFPYRLARMRDVQIRGKFPYPEVDAYDPQRVFKGSFGIFIALDQPIENIEVLLHPRWLSYARAHRWHESQQIESRADGVLVKLQARACPEVEQWVLSFGEQARVLKPESLRKAIAARLQRAAAAAGQSRPGPQRASPKRKRARTGPGLKRTSHPSDARAAR